jgi:hypothetical protein
MTRFTAKSGTLKPEFTMGTLPFKFSRLVLICLARNDPHNMRITLTSLGRL